MSEASRHRFLFLRNRLEELEWKLGPLPETPTPAWLDHTDAEPTWGPVGSLARQWLTEQQVEWLLQMDREMGVRHADAQPDAAQQAPQNRVLEASEAMSKLDRYGETPLFACPTCAEESAKASMPLDYWRCTACGTWGRASALPGQRPPGTRINQP
jgi:hypothetical protein